VYIGAGWIIEMAQIIHELSVLLTKEQWAGAVYYFLGA
jgi:hypothetical protein